MISSVVLSREGDARFNIGFVRARPDRDLFMRLMEETSGPQWTYLSANTHDPVDIRPHGKGARQINIGSTTDWPMAAHRIRFGTTIGSLPVPGPQPMVTYEPLADFPTGPELCRHVQAAEALGSLKLDQEGSMYKSPGSFESYAKCNASVGSNWLEYEKRLHRADEAIEQKMLVEEYKQRMLSIMAAASLHESRQFTLGKLFKREVR